MKKSPDVVAAAASEPVEAEPAKPNDLAAFKERKGISA